jgi:hypothetical protein
MWSNRVIANIESLTHDALERHSQIMMPNSSVGKPKLLIQLMRMHQVHGPDLLW